MTESEVRAYFHLLDGPRCGKPWSAKPDRRTVVDGICDLPAGHEGDCGHEPNRTDPWVGVARSLLATLDAERHATAIRLDAAIPGTVPDPHTLRDVVAWLRARRDRVGPENPVGIVFDLTAKSIEHHAPWRESCDGTPPEHQRRF